MLKNNEPGWRFKSMKFYIVLSRICYNGAMQNDSEQVIDSAEKTRWHRLLGKLLELLLTPMGISVETEVLIMNEPPRADIILLRRNQPQWTLEQVQLLPDGIRDTTASRIIIEFKRTESITADILLKFSAYDLLYRQTHKLQADELAPFLISARKPRASTLQRLGFTVTEHQGVYQTDNILAGRIRLISLNELDEAPFNAFLKLFATHAKARSEAFTALRETGIISSATELSWFVGGLEQRLAPEDHETIIMSQELTAEYLIQVGREWQESLIKSMPVEMKLAGLRPEQLVAALSDEEIKALEAHLQERKRKQKIANNVKSGDIEEAN